MPESLFVANCLFQCANPVCHSEKVISGKSTTRWHCKSNQCERDFPNRESENANHTNGDTTSRISANAVFQSIKVRLQVGANSKVQFAQTPKCNLRESFSPICECEIHEWWHCKSNLYEHNFPIRESGIAHKRKWQCSICANPVHQSVNGEILTHERWHYKFAWTPFQIHEVDTISQISANLNCQSWIFWKPDLRKRIIKTTKLMTLQVKSARTSTANLRLWKWKTSQRIPT